MDQRREATERPRKRFETALHDFLGMARGRSQWLVIRYFLEQIVTQSDLCEHGSVLVHRPPPARPEGGAGRLKLFEKSIFTYSSERLPGPDFSVDEGLAAFVFRKRAPEFAAKAVEHAEFIPQPGQDIGAIYCIPIRLDDRPEPFGVVSFHNRTIIPAEAMSVEKRLLMEISVKVLEATLSLATLPFVDKERIFIVHGRSEALLAELEDFLRENDIEPVVVKTYARTGQDLLSFIEERIRDCLAGFVLLTPDDEGRLYQFGEPLRQRARQNVIFEGGYLTALFRRTNRVCFLQQGDLEIPSDLNGLLMERCEQHIDRDRIALTLREWGLSERGAAASPAASAGPGRSP